MKRPVFFVYAPPGFGYQSDIKRTLFTFPSWETTPEWVRKNCKRISQNTYRKLFPEVFGGSADRSIASVWEDARRLKKESLHKEL